MTTVGLPRRSAPARVGVVLVGTALIGALLAGCGGSTQADVPAAGGAAGAAPSAAGQTLPPGTSTDPRSHGGGGSSGGSGQGGSGHGGSGQGGAGQGGTAGTTPAPGAAGRSTDTLTVSRCWTNATATHGGQLLIQVTSSDPAARILAYRPDGSLIGEVLNSIGVSRRDLPLMPYQQRDPAQVTLVSSSGARVTVPTTPFEQE